MEFRQWLLRKPHLQTAYKHFPTSNSLEVSEKISKRVLSLPINLEHSSYIVISFAKFTKMLSKSNYYSC